MTKKQRKTADIIEGGLVLLLEALERGDPHREIIVRVKDLLFDVKSLTKPQVRDDWTGLKRA